MYDLIICTCHEIIMTIREDEIGGTFNAHLEMGNSRRVFRRKASKKETISET